MLACAAWPNTNGTEMGAAAADGACPAAAAAPKTVAGCAMYSKPEGTRLAPVAPWPAREVKTAVPKGAVAPAIAGTEDPKE